MRDEIIGCRTDNEMTKCLLKLGLMIASKQMLSILDEAWSLTGSVNSPARILRGEYCIVYGSTSLCRNFQN